LGCDFDASALPASASGDTSADAKLAIETWCKGIPPLITQEPVTASGKVRLREVLSRASEKGPYTFAYYPRVADYDCDSRRRKTVAEYWVYHRALGNEHDGVRPAITANDLHAVLATLPELTQLVHNLPTDAQIVYPGAGLSTIMKELGHTHYQIYDLVDYSVMLKLLSDLYVDFHQHESAIDPEMAFPFQRQLCVAHWVTSDAKYKVHRFGSDTLPSEDLNKAAVVVNHRGPPHVPDVLEHMLSLLAPGGRYVWFPADLREPPAVAAPYYLVSYTSTTVSIGRALEKERCTGSWFWSSHRDGMLLTLDNTLPPSATQCAAQLGADAEQPASAHWVYHKHDQAIVFCPQGADATDAACRNVEAMRDSRAWLEEDVLTGTLRRAKYELCVDFGDPKPNPTDANTVESFLAASLGLHHLYPCSYWGPY